MVADTLNDPDEQMYWLRKTDGSVHGPMELALLSSMARRKTLDPSWDVSLDQMGWIPAGEMPEIRFALKSKDTDYRDLAPWERGPSARFGSVKDPEKKGPGAPEGGKVEDRKEPPRLGSPDQNAPTGSVVSVLLARLLRLSLVDKVGLGGAAMAVLSCATLPFLSVESTIASWFAGAGEAQSASFTYLALDSAPESTTKGLAVLALVLVWVGLFLFNRLRCVEGTMIYMAETGINSLAVTLISHDIFSILQEASQKKLEMTGGPNSIEVSIGMGAILLIAGVLIAGFASVVTLSRRRHGVFG